MSSNWECDMKSLMKKVACATFLVASFPLSAGNLVFDAEFDSQKDWNPDFASQRHIYPTQRNNEGAWENLPGKFDTYYLSEKWNPKGDNKVIGSEPACEIVQGKSRNPGGKSLVIHDESWGGPSQWGADCVLGYHLDKEYPELWFELYIKFDPNWIWMDELNGGGQSTMKLIRARRYADMPETTSRFAYFGEVSDLTGPVAIADLTSWTYQTDTGQANSLRIKAFLRDYVSQSEYLQGERKNRINLDTSVKQGGKSSLSWKETLLDNNWHKINVYLKMDSAPGNSDGVFEVWIDDHLELQKTDVAWRDSDDPHQIGWDWIAVGGNMHNYPYQEEDQYEQWVAIDDFKVFDGKPGSISPPKAPADIQVE